MLQGLRIILAKFQINRNTKQDILLYGKLSLCGALINKEIKIAFEIKKVRYYEKL